MPAIITVTSLTDDGSGGVTLREALEAANTDTLVDGVRGSGTDTIQFAAGLFASPEQTITLGGTELLIASNLTITGPGASLLSIDGNAASRIFRVASGSNATLTGLTLTNGNADLGGGIQNVGTLTLSYCTLSGNSSTAVGGGIGNVGTLTLNHCTLANNSATTFGGGIYSFGTLTLNHSTVADNTSGADGGGLYNDSTGALTVSHSTLSGNSAGVNGGGIHNVGTLTLSHSTLAGNLATGDGGGIDNFGTAIVSNSTLAYNSAFEGGGIDNRGTLTVRQSTIAENNGGGINNRIGGTARLQSTIVAYNNMDLVGTFRAEYSLIMTMFRGEATIRETVVGSNRFGVDPLLSLRPIPFAHSVPTLADNGGPTLTYAPLPGSPAINRGFNYDAQPFDQRGPGFVRAVDRTDIGAYEVQKKGAYLVRDPNHATRRFVIVVGSTANDTITVALVAPTLNVTLNGKLHKFAAANIGGVFVLGDDGNDTLTLTSLPTNVGGIVYGGRGDDVLTGSGGNDILLGGAGDDRLLGLAGADVLIGGEDSDSLTGGNGDDLLIGGSTLYDSQVDALLAIRAEWGSAGSYETRVNNLRQGSNGAPPLDLNAVFDGYYDELTADTVAGTGGREFLFADDNDFLTGVVASGLTAETVVLVQ